VLVLTDSRMAPLARHAHALLLVHEGSAFAFRSLTNTLCIGQALFVALAYRSSPASRNTVTAETTMTEVAISAPDGSARSTPATSCASRVRA